MLLVHNSSNNPAFNLALEEYLLRGLKKPAVMLWRNSKSIIVGCNQNTIEEIDREYTEKHGICVIRRQTGGGAVFHDLGNINYTYITDENNNIGNYGYFCNDLIEYLRQLGVAATLSGRNDLLIDGKKFCGNAQAMHGGMMIHHGCILYSADLSELSKSLRVKPVKIESKGIKSVSSRVTNIIDHLYNKLTSEQFLNGFEKFLKQRHNLTDYFLTKQDRDNVAKLMQEKYLTYEWNYGASPKCNFSNSIKFPYGLIEVNLEINEGIIKKCKINGDFFGKRDILFIEDALTDVRYEKNSIAKALKGVKLEEVILGSSIDDLLKVILD